MAKEDIKKDRLAKWFYGAICRIGLPALVIAHVPNNSLTQVLLPPENPSVLPGFFFRALIRQTCRLTSAWDSAKSVAPTLERGHLASTWPGSQPPDVGSGPWHGLGE
jgi:hypothetical protein